MKESSSFSWTKVVKTCDNNEKLAKTMLERFEQLYFDDAIKQLHDSITKDDNNDISNQLHSLWTNFLYIGAVNGETIVKEIETIMPQKNKDGLVSAYLELLDEMKEIKRQVSKALNSSPKLQDIEQYEKEIAKSNPQAKQTNLRSKAPGTTETNKSSKVIHTKLVQEKIRIKELQLDPTRLQSAYTEIKSPEFAVPKSRILDFAAAEQNPETFVGTAIQSDTANKARNVSSGVGAYQAHDLSDIKMKQNGNINQTGLEVKQQENNIQNKPNANLNPIMQRLAQAAVSLSFDKILLELKQFQDVLKGASALELMPAVTKLEASAQKQIKNLTIDQTLNLIKETKRLRPNLLQAKVDVPTAEELDKYEKDIRQKFSHNNEFGVEVALEGKKDGSKTTCCSLF